MAAQNMVQTLLKKNIVSKSGQLLNTVTCPVKMFLLQESSIRFVCNRRLLIRNFGTNVSNYCREMMCHHGILHKVIQITVEKHQNQGIRLFHNLNTRNLLRNDDPYYLYLCRRIANGNIESHQEQKNLKLEMQHSKDSHHGRRKRLSVEIQDIIGEASSGHLEDMDINSKELDAIKNKFPHPKGTLNNLYAEVSKELKTLNCLEISYHMVPIRSGKITKNMWACTYKVKWPSVANFSATMPSKAAAGTQAALKALCWLQEQGKLTKAGAPLLYNKAEIRGMTRVPVEVTIDARSIQDIDILINLYKKDIEPVLNELQKEESDKEIKHSEFDDENTEELFGTEGNINPITGFNKRDYDRTSINRRNLQLYNRYKQRIAEDNNSSRNYYEMRMKESRESLPIMKFRDQILSMVEENPVIIVKGEPGCGKSTQVPQFIMEEWEASHRGAHCNIIISQPRRISAISLAERVALERQERLGDVVGYQVRLKSALPKPPGGALLYCSTGIILRRLQNNPGLFGASHVILDEAHERDVNTDVLLVLLRRALDQNPELRVIVMSATINSELFQKFFNDAPVIEVPGYTYPVESIFAEDLNIPDIRIMSNISHFPVINCHHIASVIRWVDRNRPEGAILCFLPGWAEIVSVTKHLDTADPHLLVLPVHSRLRHVEQQRIFSTPPPGIRKIILATNIAETSITINDVTYVIDSGAHKEVRLNVNLGMTALGNQWVSQANVNQRRGRAGRVKPGECYHLYTRLTYNSLNKFPIPELLRVPLEKTVLDCKTYSQDEKAVEFLSQMPEPPSLEAVTQAVLQLISLDALDENEKLTPLGRRIAMFTTHPKLSKALVHASVFRCINPMVTIATLFSDDTEIFLGGLNSKETARSVKKGYHPSSDHISVAWLYHEWEMLYEENPSDALNFCYKNELNNESMKLVYRLRKLFLDQLYQCQMLDDLESYKDTNAECNKYAGSDELVKAVLLSGTNTLLYRRDWDVRNGRLKKNTNVILTETGHRTLITSESVNYKRTDFPSPYYTYFRHVQSMERSAIVVRETSLLSPLSVFLFSMGQLSIHEFKPRSSDEDKWNNHVLLRINRKKDVLLLCDNSQVRRLSEMRAILWNLINYFVMKEGIDDNNERYETIRSFHGRFLQILCNIMHKAGTVIEYDNEGNLRK